MTNAAMDRPLPKIARDDLNLAERPLCVAAIELAGNIVGVAELLSACRVTPKRRMVKRRPAPPGAAGARRTLDLPGQRP